MGDGPGRNGGGYLLQTQTRLPEALATRADLIQREAAGLEGGGIIISMDGANTTIGYQRLTNELDYQRPIPRQRPGPIAGHCNAPSQKRTHLRWNGSLPNCKTCSKRSDGRFLNADRAVNVTTLYQARARRSIETNMARNQHSTH